MKNNTSMGISSKSGKFWLQLLRPSISFSFFLWKLIFSLCGYS